MRRILIISYLIITNGASFCQDSPSAGHSEVGVEILSTNNYDLSVIQVFPEQFPEVSVMFQARNELGEPLWLLKKEDFMIRENAFDCEILDVRNISENKPLNIALVFDHSGSMAENPEMMTDTTLSYQQLARDNALPDGYIMPIDYAKDAVMNFFSSNTLDRDSMFFVGFSASVDRIPPLTNELEKFNKTVSRVRPDGWTAFYDAVYNAIDSLKEHSSQPVVIALTDGGDNSSTHSREEVIEFAKENNVPIYIIGLGGVNSYGLEYICKETDGFYYHTNDPSKLTEIYEYITKQLRSIYEVDYLSNLDNTADPTRRIKFHFTNDTLSFNYNEYEFELPDEVVSHLDDRHAEIRRLQTEQRDQEQFEENSMIYGGIGIGVLLLGIGSFMIVRRNKKRKKKIILSKIYPNPATDILNLTFSMPTSADSLNAIILDVSGSQILAQNISSSGSDSLNISELDSGSYIIVLRSPTNSSNSLQFIKQ